MREIRVCLPKRGITKISTILAALLAMMLMAFTPLVLAQQTPPSDVPADVPAEAGVIPSLALLRPTPPLDARTCMATLQLSARSTKMGLSRYPMSLRPPSSYSPMERCFC